MKVSNRSPLVAFLLSFIPGCGHLYIGRFFRFILYGGGFFGPILFMLFIGIVGGYVDGEMIAVSLVIAFFFGMINMIDMLITIARGKHPAFQREHLIPHQTPDGEVIYTVDPLTEKEQHEKTKVMLLSFVPGIGHMYMGLLQRGITTLIAFIGSFGIVLFMATALNIYSILVFWLVLPVIWVYSMFDAMALLQARQRGEEIEDQSLFTNLEEHMVDGKKNRIIALVLSVFPGAGHLYLGLQQRGLQLMGGFLAAVYIMDQLRLTLFLFLLPILWCYSFFDMLQQLRRLEQNTLKDEPFVTKFVPYQRWIGMALLLFGFYFLVDRVASEWIAAQFPKLVEHYFRIKYMIPTIVFSFITILLGIKLLFGQSTKQANYDRNEEEL